MGPKRKAEEPPAEEPEAKEQKVEEAPPPPKPVIQPDDPNMCWEFKQGRCFKGTSCPWSHGPAVQIPVESLFRKGTRVLVQGLQSKTAAKFNGRVGECEELDA